LVGIWPLVTGHHAVNRDPVAVPTAKARRVFRAAILLGGPSSLVSAEPEPKGLHGPKCFERATSGCRQGVGLALQLIPGPTPYEAYEAHCTRLQLQAP